MALYSRSYYSGDGTTTDFTVGFPYLDKAHVKVYLDGILSTAWSWVGDTTVRLTTAPTSGVTILVKRETSPTARLVDYTAPSSLNEQDLDDDSLQAFYLNQEALDQANSTVGDDPVTGQFTAAGKRITNVADPVNDQDAATKSWVSALWTSITATLNGYAASALASKNAAATSESNAATSATNAHTSEVNAAASAAAAAASASTLTDMPTQMSAATATAFADADLLAARKNADGSLIKRTWGTLKSDLVTSWGPLIAAITAKGTPVGADGFLVADSAAAGASKFVTFTQAWSNYFKGIADGLYQAKTTLLTAFVGLANASGVLTNDGSGNLSWAQAGGLVKLTGGVIAAGSSSLDIPLTSYAAYKGGLIFYLSGVLPSTAADLQMLFSTNGGTSFDSGASNYQYAASRALATGAFAMIQSNGDTKIVLVNGVDSTAGGGVDATITMLNQTDTTKRTKISYLISALTGSGNYFGISGGAERTTVQDTDAVRFQFSTGTISAGTYEVFGVV